MQNLNKIFKKRKKDVLQNFRKVPRVFSSAHSSPRSLLFLFTFPSIIHILSSYKYQCFFSLSKSSLHFPLFLLHFSQMQKQKMGKQSKSRKTENVGKGKVTPVQIAFIVDRYLSDNRFTETRSTFRSEASHLLAKSPINEVLLAFFIN